MSKTLTILIALLAAAYLVLSYLDEFGQLNAVWARVLPTVWLEQEPTVQEQLRAKLSQQSEATSAQVYQLRDTIAAHRRACNALQRDLARELDGEQPPHSADLLQFLASRPVAGVLVHSIARNQDEVADAERQLTGLETRLEEVKARIVALNNGLSFFEARLRPGDALEREVAGQRPTKDRYSEIIKQACAQRQDR